MEALLLLVVWFLKLIQLLQVELVWYEGERERTKRLSRQKNRKKKVHKTGRHLFTVDSS